ncbi:T-cell ecto-ADP-ribosyltransferase 1 isoform X2 [Onychostoma macrolepis]|uniref:NAD(P)(+)--arginine ADP-ribosyltransferase n=2 Tax=Onychostoma macrolepis TaxID=369639 RepID=A0A7J6DHL3_9TELE|nr:T-cell ecto-ADP-ribosyltransferase 1 isoform X2 [Onychostoma macrolepis]XP_058635377.1 T-cell ecto-ADP-ribosyltransferase 1 isoform X2 [Onychostoma macrolepis]KAF4118787.1 hypothetical protein G5714_000838 [Onychostoma macrolepis]
MGSLRFPAVLLVLLYTMAVKITEEAIQMGMLPEAADYSFQNCRKEMLQMVTKGLLQTELNNNPDFKTMWKGNATCSKTIPGSTPLHMAALKSYAEASSEFRGRFKKLFQTSRGSSTYRDEFPFKSLFFLLTDAMQLMSKNKIRTVYSGKGKEYSTEIGEKVHFESFLPAESLYNDVTEDANVFNSIGTVFIINSSSVISFEDYGCDSEEINLLISPTEVFTVTGIKTVHNSNDHFKKITLTHSHLHSSSNCSGLVSLPEESEESSSSFLSSSLLNLVASLLMLYYYTLTL